ncbi:unnamed protein product, partial [Discosporangium mesarthrocarpum]
NQKIRLELWYQFDPFAEMCSHMWPEEPFQPAPGRFSPNKLYRKAVLLWELFKPYANALREINEVLSWDRPLGTLKWIVLIVFMLLFPVALFAVVNGYAMWVVTWTCRRGPISAPRETREPPPDNTAQGRRKKDGDPYSSRSSNSDVGGGSWSERGAGEGDQMMSSAAKKTSIRNLFLRKRDSNGGGKVPRWGSLPNVDASLTQHNMSISSASPSSPVSNSRTFSPPPTSGDLETSPSTPTRSNAIQLSLRVGRGAESWANPRDDAKSL